MRMTAKKFLEKKGDLFAMYLFPNEQLWVINYITKTDKVCDDTKVALISDFINNRKAVAEALAFVNR